jgi:hypothetical protein
MPQVNRTDPEVSVRWLAEIFVLGPFPTTIPSTAQIARCTWPRR